MTNPSILTDTYVSLDAEKGAPRSAGDVPDADFIKKRSQSFQQRKTALQIRKSIIGTLDDNASQKLHFSLGVCIGQGAYGLIHSAIQNSINREIAIKIIRPELINEEGIKSLLLSEAIVIGDLDHPNIVPIHDLGLDQSGNYFYTMKRIKGIAWHDTIATQTEAENIDILMRVCDAIAFAHDKGVIHRDLKPQNIMIGNYGEVFVMDWGIAVSPTGKGKAEVLSGSTDGAGTPVYMAPEMVNPDMGAVTHLSDIYLLGGILYQIKTGLTPHTGTSLPDCLKRVKRNEIQPTDIKSELVDIALKAMRSDPRERYQSVVDFQQAIREYQSHSESIALVKNGADYHQKAFQTRVYNDFLMSLFSYKNAIKIWPDNQDALDALRQVQLDYATCAAEKSDYDLAITLLDDRDELHRNLYSQVVLKKRARDSHQKNIKRLKRGAVALCCLVILILVVAFIIINAEKDRALLAEKKTRIAQKSEIQQRKKAERENYDNTIALVARKINDHLYEPAHQQLMQLPVEMRGWEWGRLKRQCALDLVTFKGQGQPIEAVAFAPDEKTIATASKNSMIIIWDVASGKQLKRLSDFYGTIRNLWYADDGQTIHVLNTDGLKIVWDVASGRMLEVGHSQTMDELFVFYSRDKRYFIKRTLEDTAVVQSVKQNKAVSILKGHTGSILAADFSPDNKLVVTGSADKTAIVWDRTSGEQFNILLGHAGTIQSVKVSQSGKYILTGSTDKTAKLWNVEKSRDREILKGHKRFVSSVAFSPDGRSLATASHDRTIRLWNIATQQVRHTLTAHTKAVHSVRFSADGRYLISGGADDVAILWDVSSGQPIGTFKGHSHSVFAVAFSPDGKYAATGSWDHTAKIWHVSTQKEIAMLEGHSRPIIALSFSPDGQTIVTGSKDHTAIIWDVKTAAMKTVLKGHLESVYAVAYAPNAETIATASWDKTIRIWDAHDGRLLKTIKGHSGSVYCVAYTPDSRRVISAGWDQTVRIWDLDSGHELIRLAGHTAPIYSVAVSPDGILVATGGRDRTAIVWEADRYAVSDVTR